MISFARPLDLTALAVASATSLGCPTPEAPLAPSAWRAPLREIRALHRAPRHTPAPSDPAHVPDLGGGLLMVRSGEFRFTGDLTHGEGTFEEAVVWDATSETLPAAYGGGHFALDIEGTRYETRHPLSAVTVLDEVNDAGESYFVIGGYTLSSDAGGATATALWAMVPRGDVAPDAVILLDGTRNLGVFAHGHIESETGPEVLAIAALGTLTLGHELPDELAIGAAISATIEGEFGRVEAIDTTDAPPELTAGDHLLAFGAEPPVVSCTGTLTDRASELDAATPLTLGLEDGAITVFLPSADTIVLSGGPIEASLATPSVVARWIDDPPSFVDQISHDGPAMSGTTRLGTTVLIGPDDRDAGRPLVMIATVAEDPSDPDAGRCDVAFSAVIAP